MQQISSIKNMLIKNHRNFLGGFSYKRENLKSQNNWIIVSERFIDLVTDFKMLDSLSNLSSYTCPVVYIKSHRTPIQAKIEFKAGETLDQDSKSIDDILCGKDDHSHVKEIKTKKIMFEIFSNVTNLAYRHRRPYPNIEEFWLFKFDKQCRLYFFGYKIRFVWQGNEKTKRSLSRPLLVFVWKWNQLLKTYVQD